jgi:hypothetical protein
MIENPTVNLSALGNFVINPLKTKRVGFTQGLSS